MDFARKKKQLYTYNHNKVYKKKGGDYFMTQEEKDILENFEEIEKEITKNFEKNLDNLRLFL